MKVVMKQSAPLYFKPSCVSVFFGNVGTSRRAVYHAGHFHFSTTVMTRYRHYKGGIYEFVGDATLESDLTAMVVYRAADGALWIRPGAVFHERVDVDGQQVPRFVRIDD